MKDADKTREQLINELLELRRRNVELERAEAKHKQVEEQLKIFSLALEQSTNSFAILDKEGIVKYVNPKLLEAYGASPGDFVGKYWRSFISTNSTLMEKYQEIRRTVMENGMIWSGEVTDREKDGEAIWRKAIIIPIKNEKAETIYSIYISEDITERKQVEEALRKSEEKYRTLVENASEMIVVVQDEMLKFVNPKTLEVLGYSKDEMISIPFMELVHPEDREMVAEAYSARVKKVEGSPYINDVRIIDRYDNIKWLKREATLINWEEKPAILAFMTDITGRKQTEEALKESEERYRALFEGTPDAMFLADPVSGQILDANPAASRLLMKSHAEILGLHYLDLHPPGMKEHAKRMFTEHIRQGEQALPTEGVILRSDGSEVPVEVLAQMVNIKGDPVLHGIFRDISERKKIEEELLKIQKLESIGILAGGIAHDLNNLLTGIVGNISLAMMYKDLVEKDKRLVEAEKASMRIKDLTQQLLTFSKGGVPILQAAAIGDLLRNSVTFILRGSNVKCEFSIADDLWPAEVDEGQINQVINNLIINSQHAMPAGGTVRVSAENMDIGMETGLPLDPGAYIKISIKDEGTGIPEEHIQRIFDPFFTTKSTGSGLGLATSYSIIQKHSGHIAVESHLGLGTTFIIYLPASPVAALALEKEAKIGPVMGKGRILVMDDEQYVSDMAFEMLNNTGYRVTIVADGAEAIEQYKEAMGSGDPFDAVIIDLTVPGGMGGKETIRRLAEMDPEVKAIVSSGYSNDTVMANFREYGFKGVIAKPYRIGELSEILNKVIAPIA